LRIYNITDVSLNLLDIDPSTIFVHRLSYEKTHSLIISIMKGGRLMDSLSRMNKALEYIEEHLTDDIDYCEVSKDCTVLGISF